MNSQEKVLQWAVEAGLLKRVKRTGWWCSGVKDPESVAEHSHRMSLLAFYIAGEEGADPFKAAALGLFHAGGPHRRRPRRGLALLDEPGRG